MRSRELKEKNAMKNSYHTASTQTTLKEKELGLYLSSPLLGIYQDGETESRVRR